MPGKGISQVIGRLKETFAGAEAASRPERRPEIDWLRIFAVLLLIFFHSACIFVLGEGNYHLKNAERNWEFTSFVIFVAQFHMQLFFFLAGASTCLALSFRKGGQYVVERVKRLGIPFLFGVLVIIPPLTYVEILGGTGYPGYTQWLSMTGYHAPYHEFYWKVITERIFRWGHLWFILYLLTFSGVALPLFLFLRKEIGQRLISRLVGFFEKPGAIFLLAVPLVAFEVLLRPGHSAGTVGWLNFVNDLPNLVYYGMFFLFGFLIYSDDRFGRAVERHGLAALVLALAFSVFVLALYWTHSIPPWGTQPPAYFYTVFHSFASWCWIIALLSLGRKLLTFSNRLLPYAREAAYPFYILHQTVILAIAYFVIQWNMGVVPKYLVISLSSLLATVVAYDILVRRTNVTRFLFGMRPKKKLVEEGWAVSFQPRQMAGSQGDGYYIVCEDLFKIYKLADLEVVALRGLDLKVKMGELMAIVGASGSGKTTLLNILGGLDVPSAGKVVVGGRDLLKMSSRDLISYRRQDAGFVWQQVGRNLIPYLSAFQNVELPLILLGWPRRQRRRRAREMLEAVGLGTRLHYRPNRLSGGEQQRVAIAVALAHNPPLLLADEPSGELDSQTAASIFDLFRSLNETYGVTIVIVTHDIRIIDQVDRVVTIRDGRTSLEAIRRPGETVDEFVIVDNVGRLQIPKDYLDKLDLKERVRLLLADDHITVWPEESQKGGDR